MEEKVSQELPQKLENTLKQALDKYIEPKLEAINYNVAR